ncbi:MAG: hypothetical protein NC933_00990 [Candidatus Omnitrophica bacterium]|nr:hypothetical protein [Candidatus Omnitrophota bacterium]
MKMRIRAFVFMLFLFCCTCVCHGAGTRVLVVPFEDKTGELKGVEKDMTAAVIEEINSSRKYTHVTGDKFAENWIKTASEGDAKPLTPEAEIRLKDLRHLKPLLVHDELGAVAGYRDRWGADLVITGEIRKEGEALKLYSDIIGVSSGRFYSLSGQCPV